MRLTEKKLRQYVRESINSLLNEMFICEAQGDLTTSMRSKINKYITNKINSGDENINQLLGSLGYDLNYDINARRNRREEIFGNNHISQEVTDDILNAANILANYTDKNGNIYIFVEMKPMLIITQLDTLKMIIHKKK